MPLDPRYQRIYAAVARIPTGRVATYGQIAEVADLPGRARMVGYALRSLPPGSPIPWHRVINAQGRISTPTPSDAEQRRRLRAEGVLVSRVGHVDLCRFGATWRVHRR